MSENVLKTLPIVRNARSLRFTADFVSNTRVYVPGNRGARWLDRRSDCPSGFGFPEYTLNVAGTDGAHINYAPEGYRDSMIENVPLHRDVMKAWEDQARG